MNSRLLTGCFVRAWTAVIGVWPLIVGLLPCFIRIKQFNPLGDGESVRPQVLLIDDALRAYDKRLHPGYAVLRGCRNEGKAANHRALDYVIELAQRRRWALSFKNLEVIAVES